VLKTIMKEVGQRQGLYWDARRRRIPMVSSLFSTFAPKLRAMTDVELSQEIERPQSLLIDVAVAAGKEIHVAYAPFDHVNLDARIVIIGLTPGRQQMRNALVKAQDCLRWGKVTRMPCAPPRYSPAFPVQCESIW